LIMHDLLCKVLLRHSSLRALQKSVWARVFVSSLLKHGNAPDPKQKFAERSIFERRKDHDNRIELSGCLIITSISCLTFICHYPATKSERLKLPIPSCQQSDTVLSSPDPVSLTLYGTDVPSARCLVLPRDHYQMPSRSFTHSST
jgi:hypothetical protein